MEEENKYHAKSFDINVWKKMLPFLSPYKKRVFVIIFSMFYLAGIDILVPIFMGYAMDNFIEMQSTRGIWLYTLIYVLMIISQGFMVLVMGRNGLTLEIDVGRDLKRSTFLHLQNLGLSYYNQNAVGWILARVMSDTNRISGVIAWSFTDIFWSLFLVLGVFVAMLILNWQLALLVIVVVPITGFLVVAFQGKFLSAHRDVRSANSKITGAFNEGISGAKTSKTLVIEERNCEDFKELTKNMYNRSLYAARLNAVFIPIITFFSSFAVSAVLIRGGILSLENRMQIGMFSIFITYALLILEPVQHIARVLADFISTQANIERVDGLLTTECTIKDTPAVVEKYGDALNPKTENWEPIKGDIEFKNVWFKYPDGNDWILEDFSLKIPAGTNVALVGETGAGKSTLVNLACRFFEPTEGTVLIDGRDYRERSQLWLHSRLGYVLQNPHLFSGTVKDNIRYGRLDATDEEIYAAAKMVSADLAVAKLENGYDTDVGEGGDRLSTGEKQLVSFARAVLANPPIFVLDEATSSIDTETEQLIQNAISHVLAGRTSFLVAHRLSTIRHADLILVVKGGKITERGTHDELMAAKGYYHSLYTAMKIDEAR